MGNSPGYGSIKMDETDKNKDSEIREEDTKADEADFSLNQYTAEVLEAVLRILKAQNNYLGK